MLGHLVSNSPTRLQPAPAPRNWRKRLIAALLRVFRPYS
jgi:hypothetical protein